MNEPSDNILAPMPSTSIRVRTCYLLVFLLLSFLSCSREMSPEDLRTTVLYDVTVIDGTGQAPMKHQAILLRGPTISAIGAIEEIDLPDGARTLDLAGRFVLPGFIDLHVHFPGEPEVDEAILRRLLESGITTALQPGARPGTGVYLRDQLEAGKIVGPRLRTSGPILNSPVEGEVRAAGRTWVTSEAAARAAVRAQAAQGVDFIKLYRDLPPDLVAATIEEAHHLGLRVAGHMGRTTWQEAASLGVDVLMHSGWGTPMDELVDLEDPDAATDTEWYLAYADAPKGRPFARLVASLQANKVVVVPTLSIHQASGLGHDDRLLHLFETDLAPEADLAGWWGDRWRQRHPQYDPDSEEEAHMMATVYFPAILDIVRSYFERGVRLGVGTDVGNAWMTPGVVYHHELELYQQAGIPPLSILSMASQSGAEALGLQAEIGTVETGKVADLIILREDPTVDIRNTRSIEFVIQAGRLQE